MIGDSAIIGLKKGASIFRSRSTVICLYCVTALLVLACIVMKAGYFDAGFGAACILMLREISHSALDHQRGAAATPKAPTTADKTTT